MKRAVRLGVLVGSLALIAQGAVISSSTVQAGAAGLPGCSLGTDPNPEAAIPKSSTLVFPKITNSPVSTIKVVPRKGGGSFIDTRTKKTYFPRGAVYVRKLPKLVKPNHLICPQVNFGTGSGDAAYNPIRAIAALTLMHSYGYNVVHVGLSGSDMGNPKGLGLNPRYLRNVASFINIARSNGIRVILTFIALPTSGGYLPAQADYNVAGTPKYHNRNLYYLDRTWIQAQQRFFSDFIDGLRRQHAAMTDIFSLELAGEQVWYGNFWPLNLTTGSVHTAARSKPYNMADPVSRVAMMNDNSLNWQNSLTATIKRKLPSTLVSVGFFAPYDTRLDPQPPVRLIHPESSFSSKSRIDFVDLHMYPIFGPLPQQLASLHVNPSTTTKPIILGEVGVYRSEAPNATVAGLKLLDWQHQSCSNSGFHISGWIVWTWDTTPSEQPGLFNMLGGGAGIASALAPNTHPNPCR